MRLRIHNLTLPHDADIHDGLSRLLEGRLGDAAGRLRSFEMARRSIDARKGSVRLVFSVDVDLEGSDPPGRTEAAPPPERIPMETIPGRTPITERPVVVGAGPAGLMAAYLLAKHGYRPTLLDRGGDVAQRAAALEDFSRTRTPDPECNALFGIGGAGTFSDGKLTTTLRHPWMGALLDLLVECGAPPAIAVDAKPHIGTDHLGRIATSLVRRIEDLGGRVLTGRLVTDIGTGGGAVCSVKARNTAGSGVESTFETGHVVLAIGHSARDTLEVLETRGAAIAPKPFQAGIRVEHPQRWIDERQYGKAAGNPALGAADYKLTARAGQTPVFSFCMCPGGQTMPTINEPGNLCLNGMSNSARDSRFSSSGIVATIDPIALGARTAREAVELVRGLERACFELGGSDYTAPAQRLVDLAAGRASGDPLPETSYRLGHQGARLDLALPVWISAPIREGLGAFDRRMPGYLHPEAVALAPEARASSPVRIERDPGTRQSVSLKGLYPVGEGAGYAGGIISSALDGLNTARRIIEGWSPPA